MTQRRIKKKEPILLIVQLVSFKKIKKGDTDERFNTKMNVFFGNELFLLLFFFFKESIC